MEQQQLHLSVMQLVHLYTSCLVLVSNVSDLCTQRGMIFVTRRKVLFPRNDVMPSSSLFPTRVFDSEHLRTKRLRIQDLLSVLWWKGWIRCNHHLNKNLSKLNLRVKRKTCSTFRFRGSPSQPWAERWSGTRFCSDLKSRSDRRCRCFKKTCTSWFGRETCISEKQSKSWQWFDMTYWTQDEEVWGKRKILAYKQVARHRMKMPDGVWLCITVNMQQDSQKFMHISQLER